jgi:CheY-like chemotaxis protein
MTLRRTINITRILLIDDDPLARNILRQILELDGHMVVDAANGAVAMQRWSEQPADLIVTDILMPEKDGLEVIRELRRQCPQLKVIAVDHG